MEWKDLSIEARSIIEWVENPYTSKRETIKIEVGGYFNPSMGVNILITKELFDEILSWVEWDKELISERNGSKLMFRLSDDSEIKLH